MNETTPLKRLRARPHTWALFIHLERGECFTIGKSSYVKASLFSAVDRKKGTRRFVNPFRTVRTERLVKAHSFVEGHLPATLLGPVGVQGEKGPDYSALGAIGPDGVVGDPGGCCGKCDCVSNDQKRRDAVILQALAPHNDNNITGPTC